MMKENKQNSNYKYFAFISYNSKDIKWGKRLQRKLEEYKMPATLCSERGWERKPIKPIFFAPTDIQPGGLSDELKERLRASRNLIVICSPNSAKSEWVGREIEFFHSLGRGKKIYFFIVDGIPNSGNEDTECFNPIVKKLGIPEILGANIHEKVFRYPWLNRERAYVQLITKLLDVEFDYIWQRHKRRLIELTIYRIIGVLLVITTLFGVWINSRSVDVSVRLHETTSHNSQLPPMEEAIITMTLDNETKCDTIKKEGEAMLFHNIPQKFIGNEVRITCRVANFRNIDTTMILSQDMALNICRDTIRYGNIHFQLYDLEADRPVSNQRIVIDGRETTSDTNGFVDMYIPLKEQKREYGIESDVPLNENSIVMPCDKYTVITVMGN